MRGFGATLAFCAILVSSGAVRADEGIARSDDGSALVTGRSVAVSSENCDKVTPVCAAIGSGRLVPYDNECHARADGATSVSFGGCFDEN